MALKFSRLLPDWGCPVYIIGGGTSLTGFDCDIIRGKGLLVGVNKAAWLHDCDALVTLDQHFAKEHRNDIREFVKGGGEAILAMPPSENGHVAIPGATYVYRRRNDGLSDDPTSIYGVNSGFAALGAAYLKGAPFIGLLGFDMQYGKDGRTHWHDGYRWHNKAAHRMMGKWANAFNTAAEQCSQKGIEVVNYIGEPESKIDAFRKVSLSALRER